MSTKMSPNGSATSTESILLHLLCRVDAARQRALYRQRKHHQNQNAHHHHHHPNHRLTSSSSSSFTSELRSLELWRSTIAECLASFLYVFLLCATHLTWNGSAYIFGPAPNWLVIALTSGLAMATLVQCFGHISGGQVNPALTVALAVTRKISPLRAVFYLVAHCCGAIAGAALLYGVTVTGSQSMGPLGITTGHDSLNAWQVLAVEFLLTFVVIFTTFATYDANRRSFGSDSLSIGIAYLVASLTGLPASGASMNPARTLGPAFVMNRWQYHWVYWLGPLSGGIVAAFIYEFIFDTKKASLGNYLLDTFDDLERESNVEDDYEDPDLSHHQHQQHPSQTSGHHTINLNGGGKMTMLGAHKPMYSSASAASSGSSSGHSRSNHTQHSIVSVHNGGGQQPPPTTTGLPYDAYRPMISSFGAGNSLDQQQQSPSQIYNEPTGPTSYYATGALPDRPGTGGNSSGSSANGGNGAANTTFFCPPNSTAAARFSHSTMRASLHRLNYEQQQQGSAGSSVNPKF